MRPAILCQGLRDSSGRGRKSCREAGWAIIAVWHQPRGRGTGGLHGGDAFVKKIGKVVLESLIVTVVGVGLALIANAKSGRGLDISKDYFKVRTAARPMDPANGKSDGGSETKPEPGEDPDKNKEDKYAEGKRLVKEAGFQAIEYDEVQRLYRDDNNYRNGAYIFVDARPASEYREGHIPLAWRIDHVKSDEMLKAPPLQFLLPSAEKIVLYCHGGNCEDSLLVAGDMRAAGIDQTKIHVYVGGFTEWWEKKQPIEKGDRESGDITEGGGQ